MRRRFPSLPLAVALAALALLAAPAARARLAEIFAGTWGAGFAGQGKVLQYDDGTTWREISPPGGLGDAVWDLEWVEGFLWAAVHEGPPSDRDPEIHHGTLGRVYRWDGSSWEEMSPPGGFESAATTVTTVHGQVYVTVDSVGLLRWEGGRDWTVLGEFTLGAQALVSDSHEGRPLLYIGQDNTDEFWMYDPDGLTPCGEPEPYPSGMPRCQIPTGSVCSADCHPGSCIHALAEFDDGTGPLVYGGAWFGRMYRWDPATRLFLHVDDIPDEIRIEQDLQHVQGLAAYHGLLWAGMSDGRLWASPDATAATWAIDHDYGVDEPVSEMIAVPQDDTLWIGFGGVPWRWARRDGWPGVRTFDGTDHVVRGEGPLFGQGVLVLLAVVPEIECDAGPAQVIECAGAATDVVLDASATVVSQGFPPTFTWTGDFVGGVATGVSPTVTFEGTGDHVVELSVTAGRRTETCTTTVTIADTEPPVVAAGSGCLWPPNHRYRCVAAVDLVASAGGVALDGCDGEVPVGILDAWSSQPEDHPDEGDGHTQDDVLFDAERVCVRAERLGAEPAGRTYTVLLAAVDAAGNPATVEATLVVPHDQREDRRCRDAVGGGGLLPHAELPLGPDAREGSYAER